MKKFEKFLVILAIIASIFSCCHEANGADTTPVVRIANVSPAFKAVLEQYKEESSSKQETGGHWFPTEGLWSNSSTPVNYAFDFFAVPSATPAGGRVLKMTPCETVWYGISSMPSFEDVLTGERFGPKSLETQDLRNGKNDNEATAEDGILVNYFHYGSFQVGPDTIYIVVGYAGSLRKPTVCLTWGTGSNCLNPGTYIDTFTEVSVEPVATVTELGIRNIRGETGVEDGMYLFVSSRKEFTDLTVGMSTDLKSWDKMTLTPIVVYGSTIVYKVPDNMKNCFFRSVE